MSCTEHLAQRKKRIEKVNFRDRNTAVRHSSMSFFLKFRFNAYDLTDEKNTKWEQEG